MKKFAKLSYDNFIINGEVNERLPLYNEYIENIYPLDGTIYNLNPDFQIKNGNVTYGTTSKLTSKQNVTTSNNLMTFSGLNDSYIELNGDIISAKIIDIEVKFKLNNATKVNTILSSDAFTVSFDNTNKRLIANINGIKGQYSNVGDINSTTFSLTDKNSITSNQWYSLKIYKYSRTVIVLLNDVTVRTFILDVDFNSPKLYLGRGLDGQIEYLNTRDISHVKTDTINIQSKATTGDFSICFNFKRLNENYQMFKIGSVQFNMTDGYLTINNTKLNTVISINTLYGISIGYNNGQLKVLLYDMDNGSITIDQTIPVTISSSSLSISTTKGMFNFFIYNKRLSDNALLNLYKKSFKLDKSGDIRYELDEVNGHDKLKVSVGNKYHMQLTRDLDSNCKTIKNNKSVIFVDGGVESKDDNKKVQISFSKAINMPSTWHIIYKTKITKLKNWAHYDSIGEGTYWGIEDNRFVLKYIQNQSIVTSYISRIEVNEILNEWITISLSYQSGVLTVTIFTSKGIHSTKINKTISSITGSKYDLFLGGKDDELYGEAIYRDLSIITNWNVDEKYIENMFRTKISYANNKLVSNVEIIES